MNPKLKLFLKAFIITYSAALLFLVFFVGHLTYTIYQAPNLGTLTNITADTVSFDALPKYISSAFLASEDLRYYERPGMETRAVIKSLIRGALNKKDIPQEITVVQKLVKYAFNDNKENFARDLQEAYLAFLLENTYNRKQILQMYVNHVAFANNVYGLSEASFYYFGKRPQDITMGEAAFLAAVSKAPKKYSQNNLKVAYQARNNLLLIMRKNGLIDKQKYLAAQHEEITLKITRDQPAKAFEVNY